MGESHDDQKKENKGHTLIITFEKNRFMYIHLFFFPCFKCGQRNYLLEITRVEFQVTFVSFISYYKASSFYNDFFYIIRSHFIFKFLFLFFLSKHTKREDVVIQLFNNYYLQLFYFFRRVKTYIILKIVQNSFPSFPSMSFKFYNTLYIFIDKLISHAWREFRSLV